MKDLNVCPFCGGEPILYTVGDWKQFYVYVCSKCHKTPVHPYEAKLTLRGARRVWNRMAELIKKLRQISEIINRYEYEIGTISEKGKKNESKVNC